MDGLVKAEGGLGNKAGLSPLTVVVVAADGVVAVVDGFKILSTSTHFPVSCNRF